MYTANQRLIAYILLTSHSLMSCYNLDMVRPKQVRQDVQVEKQRLAMLAIKGAEQHSTLLSNPSPVQNTTLEGTPPYATNKEDKPLNTSTSLHNKPPFYKETGEETPLLVEPSSKLSPMPVRQQQNLSISQKRAKASREFSYRGRESKSDNTCLHNKGRYSSSICNTPHVLQARIVD